MKIVLKTKFLGLALLASCVHVNAANWLMLQGTQPEFVAPQGVIVPYRSKTPKLWGFVQANYRKDFGDVLVNGAGVNQTPFSLLNSELKGQSGFEHFQSAYRSPRDGR